MPKHPKHLKNRAFSLSALAARYDGIVVLILLLVRHAGVCTTPLVNPASVLTARWQAAIASSYLCCRAANRAESVPGNWIVRSQLDCLLTDRNRVFVCVGIPIAGRLARMAKVK